MKYTQPLDKKIPCVEIPYTYANSLYMSLLNILYYISFMTYTSIHRQISTNIDNPLRLQLMQMNRFSSDSPSGLSPVRTCAGRAHHEKGTGFYQSLFLLIPLYSLRLQEYLQPQPSVPNLSCGTPLHSILRKLRNSACLSRICNPQIYHTIFRKNRSKTNLFFRYFLFLLTDHTQLI